MRTIRSRQTKEDLQASILFHDDNASWTLYNICQNNCKAVEDIIETTGFPKGEVLRAVTKLKEAELLEWTAEISLTKEGALFCTVLKSIADSEVK